MKARVPWNQQGEKPWLALWIAMIERARKDAQGIGLTQEPDPQAVRAEARRWLDELAGLLNEEA